VDEKNDGCHSCANLLDEMKEAEESLNFKMNELKEKHQQQLSDLRRSHNE
jgi:vacuolar-type H+-ATPase subunit H